MVVGLDVVVLGCDSVDLERGDRIRRSERSQRQRKGGDASSGRDEIDERKETYLSFDLVTIVVEDEEEGSKTSAKEEEEDGEGKDQSPFQNERRREGEREIRLTVES